MDELQFRIGKDWRVHFAVRALRFYAESGAIRNGLHFTPIAVFEAMCLTNPDFWGTQYKVAPELCRRAIIACLRLAPVTKCINLHSYSCWAILGGFNSADQLKIVDLLESFVKD